MQREIRDAAERLLEMLLDKYMLPYKSILRIVPLEKLRDVIVYLVTSYARYYAIDCYDGGEGGEPALLFYGTRPRLVRVLVDVQSLLQSCLRMVDAIEKRVVYEQCQQYVVWIAGRPYIKLAGNLVMDEVYLYIKDGERLRRNMRWRIIWEKYRRGYSNNFVRWAGQRIERLLPCLSILRVL